MYRFPTVSEVPSVDGLLSAGAAEEERLKALQAKTTAPAEPSTPATKPAPAAPKAGG